MSEHTKELGTTATSPTPADDHRHRIKHSVDRAEKYQHRKESKHRAEMALIRRALPGLAGVSTVLDAPCGVGRATIMLAKEGYEVTGIDLGEGALQLAREAVQQAKVDARIEREDLVKLSYADGQFDAVLCFRLIHHLPTPHHRAEIIGELCRVAKYHVLISYLSPFSYTSQMRLLKERMGGRKSVQHITPLPELTTYFDRCGYRLVRDFAQMHLVHSLHLALFTRKTSL